MKPKRKQHRPIVTRDPWNFGCTSGYGIDGYQLGPFRIREGHLFRGGKFRVQRGQLHGICVATHEEADRLALLYGYCQYYTRNHGAFVMSRAARRRGYKATDPFYLRRVADWQKRLAAK